MHFRNHVTTSSQQLWSHFKKMNLNCQRERKDRTREDKISSTYKKKTDNLSNYKIQMFTNVKFHPLHTTVKRKYTQPHSISFHLVGLSFCFVVCLLVGGGGGGYHPTMQKVHDPIPELVFRQKRVNTSTTTCHWYPYPKMGFRS